MCPNNTLLPTLSEPRPLEGRCLHKRWPVVAAGLDPLHNASAAEVWLGPRTRPIESEIEGYASEPIPGCRGPQTYPHLITSFAPPSPDTSCNSEGGAFFSGRPHSCSIHRHKRHHPQSGALGRLSTGLYGLMAAGAPAFLRPRPALCTPAHLVCACSAHVA